MQKQNTES